MTIMCIRKLRSKAELSLVVSFFACAVALVAGCGVVDSGGEVGSSTEGQGALLSSENSESIVEPLTAATSAGEDTASTGGELAESGPVPSDVEATILADISSFMELEQAAVLGDADALETLTVEAPQGFLDMVDLDRQWVESTLGTQYEIVERPAVQNIAALTQIDDSTVVVEDCVEVTDAQLRYSAERDGSPPMAFETRQYTYTRVDGSWSMTDFIRSNDGVLGRHGCIPSVHAERLESVVLEFLTRNLALQQDATAVASPELLALTGEPLSIALISGFREERDTFLTTPEEFKVKAGRVDNTLTWTKPIQGGFIIEIDACHYLPQGKVYEQVGTGETKALERFPLGAVWDTVWLVQSVPDESGGWTDVVFNGGDLNMGSDCWESEEFNG